MKLGPITLNANTLAAGSGFAPKNSQTLSNRTQAGSPAILHWIVDHVRFAWRWLQDRRAAQVTSRRMRVVETLSLGERRFVSILNVDGAQFLIGSTATSVQLLTALTESQAPSNPQETR